MNVFLAGATEDYKFIGILDIYGFERYDPQTDAISQRYSSDRISPHDLSLATNSFEQFCINYANERLQHEFCVHVFETEQDLYEQEGLEWSFMSYTDNSQCISLIEHEHYGILALLNEECKFPKGTDANFLAKIYQFNSGNPFLEAGQLTAQDTFVIDHFAYKVVYSAGGFLEKNKDNVPAQLLQLMAKVGIGVREADASGLGTSFTSCPGLATVFRQSLTSLLGTLKATQCHYIRCIKPNAGMLPDAFAGKYVLQQLKACGIIETIHISAAGYPSRWSFKEFVERYAMLLGEEEGGVEEGGAPRAKRRPDERDNGPEDPRPQCQRIFERLGISGESFQLGKSRVFMRIGQISRLENLRTDLMTTSLGMISKAWRASSHRKEVTRKLGTVKGLQIAVKNRLALRGLLVEAIQRMESILRSRVLAIGASRCVSGLLTLRAKVLLREKYLQNKALVKARVHQRIVTVMACLVHVVDVIPLAGKVFLSKRWAGEARLVGRLQGMAVSSPPGTASPPSRSSTPAPSLSTASSGLTRGLSIGSMKGSRGPADHPPSALLLLPTLVSQMDTWSLLVDNEETMRQLAAYVHKQSSAGPVLFVSGGLDRGLPAGGRDAGRGEKDLPPRPRHAEPDADVALGGECLGRRVHQMDRHLHAPPGPDPGQHAPPHDRALRDIDPGVDQESDSVDRRGGRLLGDRLAAPERVPEPRGGEGEEGLLARRPRKLVVRHQERRDGDGDYDDKPPPGAWSSACTGPRPPSRPPHRKHHCHAGLDPCQPLFARLPCALYRHPVPVYSQAPLHRVLQCVNVEEGVPELEAGRADYL